MRKSSDSGWVACTLHISNSKLRRYQKKRDETQSKKEAEQMSLLVRMPVVDVEVVEIESSASKFKPPLGVVFLQRKRVSYKLKDKQIGRKKQLHKKQRCGSMTF